MSSKEYMKEYRKKLGAEYFVWASMRQRCGNPNATGYKNYGARGIRVCDNWSTFHTFLSDMGRRPTPKHTLDRIDNDGNYEPSNCRWALRSTQNRNTRSNKLSKEKIEKSLYLRNKGWSWKDIALEIGADRTTITNALRGKSWAGVVEFKRNASIGTQRERRTMQFKAFKGVCKHRLDASCAKYKSLCSVRDCELWKKFERTDAILKAVTK